MIVVFAISAMMFLYGFGNLCWMIVCPSSPEYLETMVERSLIFGAIAFLGGIGMMFASYGLVVHP